MSEIDPTAPAVRRFWQDWLSRHPLVPADTPYLAWYFGDSRELAAELADLVLAGKKTATASLLLEYEADGEALPQVGEYSIVTDFDGSPLIIVQTVEVRRLAFEAVEPEFAADEGEGDLSLEYWRHAHWRFFGRVCTRIGRQPSMQMPVICERFRMV